MTTLSQIKQEAREELEREFRDVFQVLPSYEEALGKFLEETLDRLVDEIEKAVVDGFKCHSFGNVSSHHCPNCDNNMTTSLKQAFTRFKGESVPESECVHENNGFDFCKKCGVCLLHNEKSV